MRDLAVHRPSPHYQLHTAGCYRSTAHQAGRRRGSLQPPDTFPSSYSNPSGALPAVKRTRSQTTVRTDCDVLRSSLTGTSSTPRTPFTVAGAFTIAAVSRHGLAFQNTHPGKPAPPCKPDHSGSASTPPQYGTCRGNRAVSHECSYLCTVLGWRTRRAATSRHGSRTTAMSRLDQLHTDTVSPEEQCKPKSKAVENVPCT